MLRISKQELTALENSFLSYEGALDYSRVIENPDDLLKTRGQGKGLKLYTALLCDPHIFAEMRTLASTIISRPYEVIPAGDSAPEKKAADLVRDQLEQLNTVDISPTEENQSSVMGFDQVQSAFVMSGVLHGYHVAEVMWRTEGKYTVASEIRSRDPRQFVFAKGKHGYTIRHRTINNSHEGEDLPKRKILCFSNGGIDGNPYGFALGRSLFWPSFFKRNGMQFWLKFIERFASPKVVGKFPRGSTAQQVGDLRQALAALNQDSEVAIPDGMLVEYLEAAQAGTIDTYESLCRFMDGQISQAILGQTGTSDQSGGGGSRARDEVADQQKRDIAKAVSDNLSYTFNRLAAWIVEFNMPGTNPPQVWREFAEEEDLNNRSSRDKTLFDLGYRINQETVTEIYGEGYEEAMAEGEEPALIGTLGVAGTQALTGLLTQAATGQLPKENAIAVLTAVFGIDKKSAQAMVPEKQEQPEQNNPLASLFGNENAPKNKENVPKKEADLEPNENQPQFAEEEADDFDQLIAKARPEIMAAMAPWVDSVGDFVANAESLEEIREGLVQLHPQLAIADFGEVLAQVMQVADLVARDEVLEDAEEEDAAFMEALEAAIAGTLDFKAKKKKKGPQCKPGKSHFCRTPAGRGSCVSASKKCRYRPDGTVRTAAKYTGKQKQYKNAAAWEKAAKGKEEKKKTTSQKPKAQGKGSSTPFEHTIIGGDLFTSAELNQALDKLPDESRDLVKDFIKRNEIMVVFPGKKLTAKEKDELSRYGPKGLIDESMDIAADRGVMGLTSYYYNFIAINPKANAYQKKLLYFKDRPEVKQNRLDEVSIELLQENIKEGLGLAKHNATDGLRFENIVVDGIHDRANRVFGAYLHELGHQVDFARGGSEFIDVFVKDFSIKEVSGYASTNNLEAFAEAFAAWAINPTEYRKFDPKTADLIEKAVKKKRPKTRQIA